MTSEEFIGMTLDPRMTPGAVRVTVYFASLGDGEHPYAFDALSALLEEGGLRRVRNALARAESCGYLERHKGGRGTDRFEVTIGLREAVSRSHSASEKPPVVVVDVVDVNPPKSPTVGFLQPEAETAIRRYGELLAGGRDAIRDYLRDVVPLSRQAAWVDDIAGKINGLGINWKGVELGDRPGLVAAAVNELRASGEGEMKYQPGDPRNTRTKLGVLIDSRVSPMRYGGGARASPKRGQPAEGDYGEGTTTFEGLNG